MQRAIGIEISFAEVELARHRYPHIPFEHFDCFEYKERLLELTTQSTCVFVDINGNRELESVVELTNIVMGSRGIRLLVVKSKTLMRSLMLQFPNEVCQGLQLCVFVLGYMFMMLSLVPSHDKIWLQLVFLSFSFFSSSPFQSSRPRSYRSRLDVCVSTYAPGCSSPAGGRAAQSGSGRRRFYESPAEASKA